jgi:hypothetical protein
MNFISDNPEPTHYKREVTTLIQKALDVLCNDITNNCCPSCGKPLSIDQIDMYDHEYGWKLTPLVCKQWLSVHCFECDFDISLNKIGVDRYSNSLTEGN